MSRSAQEKFNVMVSEKGLVGYDYDSAKERGVPHCWLQEVERYLRSRGGVTPQQLMLRCLKVDAATLSRWVSRGLPKRFELRLYEGGVWDAYVELVRGRR